MVKKSNSRFISSFGLLFSILAVGVGASFLGLHLYDANAAGETIVWNAAGDGINWSDTSNWDLGRVPDSDDLVTIANDAVTASGTDIDFGTLTLGNGTDATSLTLTSDINAGTNIVIKGNATFTQNNANTQTISGDITIENGGVLTHSDNSGTDTLLYKVDFSAANIDIQTAGNIDIYEKGYDGGAGGSNGRGPAGGTAAASAGNGGAGGANGGDGGGAGQIGGGVLTSGPNASCDFTNPSDAGSGGGGGFLTNAGGDGGGLAILNASGTVTINGGINMYGGMGSGGTYAGGGGAGGSLKITTANIAGTTDGINGKGGMNASGTYSAGVRSGGGGGGCALIQYSGTSTISGTTVKGTSFDFGGGDADTSPGEMGGGGLVYLKKTSATTIDDLYVLGNRDVSGDVTTTTQVPSSVTVDAVIMEDDVTYQIPSSKTLALNDTSFLAGGDNSGTLQAAASSVFTPPTTFTVADATLQLHDAATLTSESSWAMTIANNGVVDMRDFTVSSGLSIASLVIQSGGSLTHGANTSSQTHVVNLTTSGTLTIDSGGTVNLDAKGYTGGAGNSPGTNGNGVAGGIGAAVDEAGSGGAHGGNGGNGSGTTGATAYCSPGTDVTTMGSGGGAGYADDAGGTGGGLGYLTATDQTMTINGSLLARGNPGASSGTHAGGGGAGGGFKLTADVIAGTPDAVNLSGGNGNTGSFGDGVDGGGGGGGCMRVVYATSTVIDEIGDITIAGGSAGGSEATAGSIGAFAAFQSNSAPAATNPSSVTQLTDGSGYVTFTTTISDSDADSTNVKVEYSDDSGSTWYDAQLVSVSGTGSPTIDNAEAYQVRSVSTASANALTITWDTTSASNGNGALTGDQTDIQVRVTPNDGTTDGSVATVAADFEVDNLNPSGLTALAAGTPTSSTQVLTWTAVTESNFDHYEIWYGTTESDVENRTGTATEWDNSDDSDLATLATATTTVTGLTGPNVQYYYKIWAVDTVGNEETVTDISAYTAANAPNAPSLVDVTSSTMGVGISVNSNPSTTEFAIRMGGNYVQADGTLGASEAWQTYATWGSVATVSGLSSSSTYVVDVKARNGDNVETSFSGSESKTTSAGGGGGASFVTLNPSSSSSTTSTPTSERTDPTDEIDTTVFEDEFKEDAPVVDETPVDEEVPVVEEKPVVVEKPVIEPIVDEVPVEEKNEVVEKKKDPKPVEKKNPIEKTIEELREEIAARDEVVDVKLVQSAIEEAQARQQKTVEEIEKLNRQTQTVKDTLADKRITNENQGEVARAVSDLAKDSVSAEVVKSLVTGETKVPVLYVDGRPVAAKNIKEADNIVDKVLKEAEEKGKVGQVDMNGNGVSDVVEIAMDQFRLGKVAGERPISQKVMFGADKNKLSVSVAPKIFKAKANVPAKTGNRPLIAVNIPKTGGVAPPIKPQGGVAPPIKPQGGVAPPIKPQDGVAPPIKVSEVFLASVGKEFEPEVNVILVEEGNLDNQIVVARGLKGDAFGKAAFVPEEPIPNGTYNVMTVDRITGEIVAGGQIVVDGETGSDKPFVKLPKGLEPVKGVESGGSFDLVQYIYNYGNEVVNGEENSFVDTIYEFVLGQLGYEKSVGNITGYAKPGEIMVVTWKSIILSSVVVTDAKGEFEIDVPKDLPEGQHEVLVFAYDSNDSIVSNVTSLFFRR